MPGGPIDFILAAEDCVTPGQSFQFFDGTFFKHNCFRKFCSAAHIMVTSLGEADLELGDFLTFNDYMMLNIISQFLTDDR